MTTERCRVTLPTEARRPHQVVTGLLGYPRLVFDALTPFELPTSSRKRTLPRPVVDQLITAGGQSVAVYLRQALRRDGVTVEAGQDMLDHVPGKLYAELLEQVELASAAPSKWLQVSGRERRDLVALGFTVELASDTPEPTADPETQEA